MPVWYFAAAVVVGVIVGLWRKNWRVGVLVGYMIVLFSSMVLNRRQLPSVMTRLQPFETYKGFPRLIPETIVNIVSFIPIGLLAGKTWRGILVGLSFSAFIEITQLITRRGIFQIDDLINNTIGTVVGVAIIQLVYYISWKTRKVKPERNQLS